MDSKNMKKPSMKAAGVITFIFGVLIPVVLVWVITFGMDKSREYKDNGIKVRCTVTGASITGKSTRAKVKYKSPEGEWIEADCIANERVSVGQKIEGYVLPDDPENVYCPPGLALKIVFYAIAAVMVIMGWGVFFNTLKDLKKYNLLIKNGVPYRARLTSWYEKDRMKYIQLLVFSRSGEERIINVQAANGRPIVGEYYDILMTEDETGNITAALNDERLSL